MKEYIKCKNKSKGSEINGKSTKFDNQLGSGDFRKTTRKPL